MRIVYLGFKPEDRSKDVGSQDSAAFQPKQPSFDQKRFD